jgi:hypothetical protein
MILALWARFLALPEGLRAILSAIAAGALAWALMTAYLHFRDARVIREHEAEIAEAVAHKTEAAEQAAHDAATTHKQQVETTNDEARDAADGSDDPLRAAFERLRSAR